MYPPTSPPAAGRRLRLGVAAAVTLVAVPVAMWVGGGDDSAETDQPVRVAGATTVVESDDPESEAEPDSVTTTTTFQVEIDPAWIPKMSSTYSESEETKRVRDELASFPTTTTTSTTLLDSDSSS